MANVDELMSRCPLKHEIRVQFWGTFIRKLAINPISYLTLYSPPLMDVKYFNQRGFIKTANGVYENVVGVTIDKQAYADATTGLDKRLELLLNGNINELLNENNKSKVAKQLNEKFPFDVINLDYTDTLHKYSLNTELSPHIRAIETILKRQKGKQHFALFLTTYVDINSYSPAFLQDLKTHFDNNVQQTPNFLETLQEQCNCSNAEEFSRQNSNNFFAVSTLKFILLFLKDHNYSIKNADIKWLVRDFEQPERFMLHLAFDVIQFVPPIPTSRANIGQRVNKVEELSINYIRREFSTIRETADYQRLNDIYSSQINAFNEQTFELDVPAPTNKS